MKYIVAVAGLLFVFITALLFRRMIYTEGYTNTTRQVTFCPAGTTFYTNERGDDICCDGTVSGRKCNGKKVCTFREGTASLPNCSVIQGEYMKKAGTKFCPSTMPYYFEAANGIRGCSSAYYKQDSYEPMSGGTSCTIYTDNKKNIVAADSCANQKLLASMKCLVPNCSKSIQQADKMYPPLITQLFTLRGEVAPRSCVSKESVVNYANVVLSNPASGEQLKASAEELLKTLNTNLQICENAERVLVNKRLM